MLRIDVRLVHGTFRAGSADDLASTGAEDGGEWPPSPARLFSALVAADGTRERCRVTDGSELGVLAAASPPEILASGPEDVELTTLHSRYVVVNAQNGGSVQNYPGRLAGEVRPAPRCSPRHQTVTYMWPDLVLAEPQLTFLRARAARIGYLGCADTPVAVRVAEGGGSDDGRARWRPVRGDHYDVMLPVPFPEIVDVLDANFDAFRVGQPVRRSWVPARRQAYACRTYEARPLMLTMALDRSIAGRHAVLLTHYLRRAVLANYSELTGVEAPPVLSGHGFDGTGFEPALWLALPNVGVPHATGRLHGVGLVLPVGTDASVVENARGALGLVARRGLRTSMGKLNLLAANEVTAPLAARARRWSGASSAWASALPAVHETWSKGQASMHDQVRQWCRHAGAPDPRSVQAGRHPFVRGGVDHRPFQTIRPSHPDRHPYSHVVLEFGEPVRGPLVLGRGRTYGLGLMVPVQLEGC